LLSPDGNKNNTSKKRKFSKLERHATVRTSQVFFLHLEKEFLLFPVYFATRNAIITEDAISWEISPKKIPEHDTTSPPQHLKLLLPLATQGQDAQDG
jgi:hypothetical protein